MLRTIEPVGRRRLLLVLAAAFVLAAPAGADTSPLSKRLATALAVPHVSRARTAALVFDLQTGTTVFSRHDALSLAPASNEKLAVTYAALVGLGPEFRIETDVVGRGEQDGTTWKGSLLLVGHGDPTLSSKGLLSLARQVRAAGIVRVTGAVFGDESFFDARRTAPGWKSWFTINESPPLSALTVDRAVYRGRTSRNPVLSAALCVSRGAAPRRRHRRRRDRHRRRPRRRAAAGVDRVRAALVDPPHDGPPERQLHRRADAQAARDARRRARDDRGRRCLRAQHARRRGSAARRRADRRRLRALAPRPRHGARDRRDPACRLERPRGAAVVRGRASRWPA